MKVRRTRKSWPGRPQFAAVLVVCAALPLVGCGRKSVPTAGPSPAPAVESPEADKPLAAGDAEPTPTAPATGTPSTDSPATGSPVTSAPSPEATVGADPGAATGTSGSPAAPAATDSPPASDPPHAPASTKDSGDTGTPAAVSPQPQSASGSEVAAAPGGQAERIVLLAPEGPLVIELRLTIDGARPDEALQAVIDQAIVLGDVNQDGSPTWEEITKESSLRLGELGNAVPADESERVRLISLYDINRDGVADRTELARFVTRNAGASRAFNLRSSNYYRDTNRYESPVRKLLDVDGNGRIEATEIEGAVTRLRSRDADNDEMLLVSELQPPDPDMLGPLTRRRPSEPDTAHALAQVRDWGQFLFALEQMYALGQPLARRNFVREPELFDELDADQDGQLSATEASRWNEVEPHAVFELRFGALESEGGERVVLVSVSRPARGGEPPVRLAAPVRLACRWPDAVLTVFAQDAIPNDYAASARGQLAIYDADNNQYLEESEFPPLLAAAVGAFGDVDTDGNGQVTVAELAASVEQRQSTQRSQLRARAGEDRDALFAAFDADDNGRLTAREMLEVPRRLAELDRNGDGAVDVGELPTALVLGVVRADPNQDDQLFEPPANPPRGLDAPAWFIHMDENRDGDIARREFLGPMSKFAELDQDQDGLLTVAEATRE